MIKCHANAIGTTLKHLKQAVGRHRRDVDPELMSLMIDTLRKVRLIHKKRKAEAELRVPFEDRPLKVKYRRRKRRELC